MAIKIGGTTVVDDSRNISNIVTAEIAGTLSVNSKVIIPATIGTAGQVLTVNSGATAAEWGSKLYAGTNTSIVLGTTGNFFAHGLGGTPDEVLVTLVCTINEDGFTVGQEINIATEANTSGYGSTVVRGPTNVIVYFGGSGIFVHGPSGYNALNLASFDLKVRAKL
jgi:hypothetical protein